MKSSTTGNMTLATLGAAVLTRYAEAHWKVTIPTDDALEYIGAASAGLHLIVTYVGPYAQRMFDHWFPPTSPGTPATPEKAS